LTVTFKARTYRSHSLRRFGRPQPRPPEFGGSPVYADFFAAVREVNAKLAADAKVRVFGGDPGAGDYRTRDAAAIAVLKEQVLQKHGKALLIYGSGHIFRTQGDIDFLSAAGGGITRTLEPDYPGRIFVVITLGGPYPEYEKFERALKTGSACACIVGAFAGPGFHSGGVHR